MCGFPSLYFRQLRYDTLKKLKGNKGLAGAINYNKE